MHSHRSPAAHLIDSEHVAPTPAGDAAPTASRRCRTTTKKHTRLRSVGRGSFISLLAKHAPQFLSDIFPLGKARNAVLTSSARAPPVISVRQTRRNGEDVVRNAVPATSDPHSTQTEWAVKRMSYSYTDSVSARELRYLDTKQRGGDDARVEDARH